MFRYFFLNIFDSKKYHFKIWTFDIIQVVFGGNFWVGPDLTQVTPNSDILFLNLNNRAEGWYSVSGIQLPNYLTGPFVNGGIVKSLTPTNCDMMFVEFSKGNYTWTTTDIIPAAPNHYVSYVPIGINNFFPCVN